MKSFQKIEKLNLLPASAYRLLQLSVNHVQNAAKILGSNLPSCFEWTNISDLQSEMINPTWNMNCQRIEVPLKVPLGLY